MQSTLKQWTWVELEARKVLTDIARRIEEDHLEKEVVENMHENTIKDNMGEDIQVPSKIIKEHERGPMVMSQSRVEQPKLTTLWKTQITRQTEEQTRRARILKGEGNSRTTGQDTTMEVALIRGRENHQ